MKKHQFEEITAALSILVALAAYALDIKWLFVFYSGKATIDTITAIYYAAVKANDELKNRKNKTD